MNIQLANVISDLSSRVTSAVARCRSGFGFCWHWAECRDKKGSASSAGVVNLSFSDRSPPVRSLRLLFAFCSILR